VPDRRDTDLEVDEATPRWPIVVAVALPAAISAVDALVGGRALLISLLGVGPFTAAVFLGPRPTAIVSAWTLLLAVLVGIPDQIWGTSDHITRLSGLAVSAIAATVLAGLRTQRDVSLRRVTHVAEITQRAILRPVPARIGTARFAARYHSSSAEALIGGDFYDVALTPWGLRAIVGDVRGKGIDGIRLAAYTLGAFREAVFLHPDLANVARRVDERVSAELGEEDFVTAVLVGFSGVRDMEIVNFGHPAPVVCGPDGSRDLAPTVFTTPLGLSPAIVVDRFELAPGERLLLYTDGVIESRADQGSFFELAPRLPRCADAASVDDCADWLLSEVLEHVGGHLQDDLALLVVELDAGGPLPVGAVEVADALPATLSS
jgi:serine phosphatase RsbU (regulator of sigma subunit)